MQRRPYLLIHRLVGEQDVAPHVVALAAAVKAANRLFIQFQRPRQRQERDPAAAVLQVQAMPGGLGVDQQQFDLAVVPRLDAAR